MITSAQDPPADGANRISQAIADYAAVGQSPIAAEAGGGVREISAPIPVYGLGIPDPNSDPATLLDRTKQVAWRYLIFNSPGPRVADLQAGETSHPVLNEDTGLADTIVAAGKVAEQQVGGDPAYELRLLDLPMLGHSYLWAASRDPAKPDRLFSLTDQPAEVELNTVLEQASTAEREKGVAFSAGTEESGG